jgi:hypothetical protein
MFITDPTQMNFHISLIQVNHVALEPRYERGDREGRTDVCEVSVECSFHALHKEGIMMPQTGKICTGS